MLLYISTVVMSYLIGSIPTAYVLVRLFKGMDIRTYGSGNVGATNAGRLLGKWAFVVVLVLDALKGFLPVFVFSHYVPPVVTLLCAFAVLLGHMYPIYLKFSGGKGVATGLGVFAALAPAGLLVALGVFLVAVLISRMISVGSVLAAAALGVSVTLLYSWTGLIVFTWIVAAIVIYKHVPNIKRILNGTENKVNMR